MGGDRFAGEIRQGLERIGFFLQDHDDLIAVIIVHIAEIHTLGAFGLGHHAGYSQVYLAHGNGGQAGIKIQGFQLDLNAQLLSCIVDQADIRADRVALQVQKLIGRVIGGGGHHDLAGGLDLVKQIAFRLDSAQRSRQHHQGCREDQGLFHQLCHGVNLLHKMSMKKQ